MKYALKASLLFLTFSAWGEVIPLTSSPEKPSLVTIQKMKTRGAFIHEVSFNLNKIEAISPAAHPEFKTLTEKNISFSQDVGLPRLPFQSVVVVGSPSEIEVTLDPKQMIDVALISTPAQPEDCRCETKKNAWIPLKNDDRELFKVESLGKFRGEEFSRVTILAGMSDLANQVTHFYPELKAMIKSKKSLDEAMIMKGSAYDYLVISPASLISGLVDFVNYKTQAGLKVKVVRLEDVGANVAKLTSFFKSEYAQNKYKYALIVGTDDLVPNHQVQTSGSYKTPSDYPYFLMDTQDIIPDVQYGRIIASTVEQIKRQTNKWIDYQGHNADFSQYLHMIGIASDEGSNPSDDEYVKGIEEDLDKAYGITSSHFYQANSDSTPEFINKAFDQGTGYLVYLGHGSGTSWGSTGETYNNGSIKKMDNAQVLKPFVVDVACQNGILKNGYFGETFMNATNASGEAIGASMYFGGSVNISWHPPAIMARGMVKKAIAGKLDKVGDIILAGQIYLMENYTEIGSVQDNFEWYHLFGDPSSNLYFK